MGRFMIGGETMEDICLLCNRFLLDDLLFLPFSFLEKSPIICLSFLVF